jgi:ubiquitin-protein ligase
MDESFHIRINNDLKDIKHLREQATNMFDFEVDASHQKYKIYIKNIMALVGTNEDNFKVDSFHDFSMELPPQYPDLLPVIFFTRPIFHPNWWTNGLLCYGRRYNLNTTLKELIIDIVRMMQYEIVNTDSPANTAANEWYLNNKDKLDKYITKKVIFPPPNLGDSSIEFCHPISNQDDKIEIIAKK